MTHAANRHAIPPNSSGENLPNRWQAVGSVLILLALTGGVPAVLLAFGGSPLPHGLPSWEQVGRALLRPDDGTLLAKVLIAIAWLSWVAFAIAVAAEASAVVRRRRSRRIPGLIHIQGVAAYLIASATVLIPALSMPTSAAMSSPAQVASITAAAIPAPAQGHPQTSSATSQAGTTSMELSQKESLPVYVVQPHDNLWAIAQRHLGDALRWHEIADLNHNHQQPDGGRLTDGHWIRPGWRLLMPPDATGLQTEGPRARNHGEQRAGKPHPAVAAQQLPRQVPASPAAPATATNPGQRDRRPIPTRELSGAKQHATDSWEYAAGLLGAGVFAAGALTALHRLRRLQRRHRRPGERISTPPFSARAAEVMLRVAAEPDTASLVSRAIDVLSPLASKATLPPVTAVEVAGDVLYLHLAEPTPVVPPYSSHDETTWRITADALPDTDGNVASLLPTLVTVGSDDGRELMIDLERCGRLSIDGPLDEATRVLEQFGVQLATSTWSSSVTVHLIGCDPTLVAVQPDRVRVHTEFSDELLRELVEHVDASTHRGMNAIARSRLVDAIEPWPLHVLLVGKISAEEHGRLSVLTPSMESDTPGVATVVAGDSTSGKTLQLHEDGSCEVTWLHRRVHSTCMSARTTRELATLFTAARDLESKCSGAAVPDTEASVELAEPYPEALPTPRPQVTSAVDRSSPPQQTTPESGDDATAASELAPGDLDNELDDQVANFLSAEPGCVRVTLLGEVRVHARGPVTSNRVAACTETVALLASHPVGVTSAHYDSALWPDRRVRPETRHEVLARTRKWLGDAPDGSQYLPHVEDGRIKLSDNVLVDWTLFQALVRRAERRAGSGRFADLNTAMSLVQGPPFDHVPKTRYAWLAGENLEEDMLATIIDTGNELAEAYLEQGDFDGARRLAKHVQRVQRGDERSWRTLLRIEATHGNPRRVRDTLRALLTAAEVDTVDELLPETAALVGELLPQRVGRSAQAAAAEA